MFTPCRYLVHNILLVPYVLRVSWLIPKVLEDGAYSFSSLGLERLKDWTTFTEMFSKEVQVSQWYSRVTQGVWSSHGVRVLTLFSLLLRMICGVYIYGECCVPWLPILPSRMVIREGLELNQIPILWNVNGWKEMGSHEEGNLVFLFELLVCNSLGEWDFLLSFCNFFFRRSPLSLLKWF